MEDLLTLQDFFPNLSAEKNSLLGPRLSCIEGDTVVASGGGHGKSGESVVADGIQHSCRKEIPACKAVLATPSTSPTTHSSGFWDCLDV